MATMSSSTVFLALLFIVAASPSTVLPSDAAPSLRAPPPPTTFRPPVQQAASNDDMVETMEGDPYEDNGANIDMAYESEVALAEDIAAGGATARSMRGQAATVVGPIRIGFSTLDAGMPGKSCQNGYESVSNMQGGTIGCSSDNILTDVKRSILIDKLLPAAKEVVANYISVNQPSDKYVSIPSNNSCTSYFTKAWWHLHGYGKIANTDLVIYVGTAPCSGTTWAWAGYCVFQSGDFWRPVAARMNIAPRYLVWDDVYPENNRRLIQLVVHEIFHALGFTNYFLKHRMVTSRAGTTTVSTQLVRGRTKDLVVTPTVVAKARQHFNCPTLNGMELEDESGSAKSHWERRNMMQDIEQSIVGQYLSVSNITLAAFHDTGYYVVNFSAAMPLDWGRNAGCAFLEGCSTAEQGVGKFWCTTHDTNSRLCTHNRRAVGWCRKPEWIMDGCGAVRELDDHICMHSVHNLDTSRRNAGNIYSDHSRCVESDSNFFKAGNAPLNSMPARCVEMQCVVGATPHRLGLRLAGASDFFFCPEDSSEGSLTNPPGYTGTIHCPAAAELCEHDVNMFDLGVLPPTPAPPTTPTPTTSSPETPTPTTVAPSTPTPTTSAPTTPTPTTAQTETPSPTTVAPETQTPTTSAPETPTPTTTTAPGTPTPSTSSPATTSTPNTLAPDTPAATTLAPTETPTPTTVAPTTPTPTTSGPTPATVNTPTPTSPSPVATASSPPMIPTTTITTPHDRVSTTLTSSGMATRVPDGSDMLTPTPTPTATTASLSSSVDFFNQHATSSASHTPVMASPSSLTITMTVLLTALATSSEKEAEPNPVEKMRSKTGTVTDTGSFIESVSATVTMTSVGRSMSTTSTVTAHSLSSSSSLSPSRQVFSPPTVSASHSDVRTTTPSMSASIDDESRTLSLVRRTRSDTPTVVAHVEEPPTTTPAAEPTGAPSLNQPVPPVTSHQRASVSTTATIAHQQRVTASITPISVSASTPQTATTAPLTTTTPSSAHEVGDTKNRVTVNGHKDASASSNRPTIVWAAAGGGALIVVVGAVVAVVVVRRKLRDVRHAAGSPVGDAHHDESDTLESREPGSVVSEKRTSFHPHLKRPHWSRVTSVVSSSRSRTSAAAAANPLVRVLPVPSRSASASTTQRSCVGSDVGSACDPDNVSIDVFV